MITVNINKWKTKSLLYNEYSWSCIGNFLMGEISDNELYSFIKKTTGFPIGQTVSSFEHKTVKEMIIPTINANITEPTDNYQSELKNVCLEEELSSENQTIPGNSNETNSDDVICTDYLSKETQKFLLKNNVYNKSQLLNLDIDYLALNTNDKVFNEIFNLITNFDNERKKKNNIKDKDNIRSLNKNMENIELSTETEKEIQKYGINLNKNINLAEIKKKYKLKNRTIDELFDYLIDKNIAFPQHKNNFIKRLKNYDISPNLRSILYGANYFYLEELKNVDLRNIKQIKGTGAGLIEELMQFLISQNVPFIQHSAVKTPLTKYELSPKLRSLLYDANKYYIEDLKNINVLAIKKHQDFTIQPFEEFLSFLDKNHITYTPGESQKHLLKDYNITLNTKTLLYDNGIIYIEDINLAKIKSMQGVGENILTELRNLVKNIDIKQKNTSQETGMNVEKQNIKKGFDIEQVYNYLRRSFKDGKIISIGLLTDYFIHEGIEAGVEEIKNILQSLCIEYRKNFWIYEELLEYYNSINTIIEKFIKTTKNDIEEPIINFKNLLDLIPIYDSNYSISESTLLKMLEDYSNTIIILKNAILVKNNKYGIKDIAGAAAFVIYKNSKYKDMVNCMTTDEAVKLFKQYGILSSDYLFSDNSDFFYNKSPLQMSNDEQNIYVAPFVIEGFKNIK